jgi:hypothetical protein
MSLQISDPPDTLDRAPAASPQNECFQSIVPNYALLFFDHLYSEYLMLKSRIDNQSLMDLLDSLHQKRISSSLTWSDIYTFDVALVEERPLENLIRKAYDSRAKYRSIAGQKEYDEYLASKPPDLTTIIIAPTNHAALASGPSSPPDETEQVPDSAELVQRVLRADVRYLLSKFYLYYAMLPMREGLREQLTTRAVRLTKWILAVIVISIAVSYGGSALLRHFVSGSGFLNALTELMGAFGPIVGSVAFAGIVGGCVSMLQRIQSAPSEGDALFNLAALTNGWRGLSLSPLYGGIFASLLFILFAAGLLQGSAFPKIETGPSAEVAHKEEPAPTSTPSGTPAATSSNSQPADTTVNHVLVSNAANESSQPAQSSKQAKAASKPGVLKITDFLRDTGPKDGAAFALLMIWSFIAGFAERLVPDTLNRLVAKNEAIQGTNT